jgi:hypothetical protein
MKLDQPQNVAQTMYKKTVPFVVLEVAIVILVIKNHMLVIQVQIGENTIEDVLLDCGFGSLSLYTII